MQFLTHVKKKSFAFILIVILAIQFCMLSVTNLILIESNLDCDNAKMFNHIVKMWEHKSLFIPNWSYTTTLELDGISIFAIPLYGLTGDIFLACGLSNIIFAGLFVATLFYVFKNRSIVYPLVMCNLVLVPYSLGMLSYFNMMFFGAAQYIVKVMIPLILVGIIISVTDSRKVSRIDILFMIAYLCLLLLTSISSGSYVLLCGLIPLFVAYFAYMFFARFNLYSSGKIMIFLGIASVILPVIGIKINNIVLGGTRANDMTICSVHQLLGNVSSTFWGMFELFGGATAAFDLKVLSLDGIALISKLCFVIIILICGIISVCVHIRKKQDLQVLLLIAIFIWNYFILTVTNNRAGSATSEFRYHLIGMIPLLCVAVIVILDWFESFSHEQRRALKTLLCCAILFLVVVSYEKVYTSEDDDIELKQFCEYFEKEQYDYIYLYDASNDSDICRVLDRNNTYICLTPEGVTWVYDYYSHFVNTAPQTADTVVAVNNAQYNFEDTFVIGNHTLIKFAEVANRSIYYFSTTD